MQRIVGILLASGRGTRFGGDKLLAAIARTTPDVPAGTPVGVAAASHLKTALADAIAVVRPGDANLADQMRAGGLRVVSCAHADDGMGATLACGVVAAADADGWVIALADMPWIAPATIAAVAAALAAGADIAAPAYHGARGHPVGFSRRHYAALAVLSNDAGARSLIERHRDGLILIDVEDPGILADIDTPGDL